MEVRQEQCPAPGDLALETVREWTLWLTEVERGLMPHFARCEARHRAWAYLRGLRSPVERKNGGQLAEVNGDATPYGLQHLLGRARWDADAVRDDLRAYLVTLFWDAGVFCSDVVRAASRVCKAVEKEGLQGGEQDKSRGGAPSAPPRPWHPTRAFLKCGSRRPFLLKSHCAITLPKDRAGGTSVHSA